MVDGRTGAEEVVCIQDASTAEVTVAPGWYPIPGVPTRTLDLTESLGAIRVGPVDTWWVMRALTGHPFCVVPAD